MANNPKMFYWLKLREDFFISNPYVKKLMKMDQGDSLVLLYLRLLTYSLKNNCVIHYQGIEESLAEKNTVVANTDLQKDLSTIIDSFPQLPGGLSKDAAQRMEVYKAVGALLK